MTVFFKKMEGLINLISYRNSFHKLPSYRHTVHNTHPQISEIVCKTMLYVTSNSSQNLSIEARDNFTADNGLYIMYILKLCSVIVMVTPVTVEDKFQEDGDLI